MNQPTVSIITVNYNETEHTLELLRSIARNSYRNVEVIVVDNASRQSPRPEILAEFPRTLVIESRQNLGFAGGNNLGVAQAGGEYLFFVNNDAELTDGCLETLIQTFEDRPRTGIVSPKLCYFHEADRDGKHCLQYTGATPVNAWTARNRTLGHRQTDRGQHDGPARETGYAHGAAMMVPRRVLLEVGPMSEDYFLYYEELDWCERIRRAGYEVRVAPDATVFHKESLATGKISSLKMYYLTRNRILFMRRNFGGVRLLPFALFFAFVSMPKQILTLVAKRDFVNLEAFVKAIGWHLKPPKEGVGAQLVNS